jgi:hypothetical protein
MYTRATLEELPSPFLNVLSGARLASYGHPLYWDDAGIVHKRDRV